MPAALPDPVLQGLGLAPPPVDSDLAGAPMGDSGGTPGPWIGGLHPSVLQGLGLAPASSPPAAPAPPDQAAGASPPGPGGELPAIPPAPLIATELPSVAERKAAGPSPAPAAPELHIPASAFGGGAPSGPGGQPSATPKAPTGPAKLLSVDQQLADARQREDQATAEGHVAIGAGLQAKQAENADTLAALNQHDETTKKIQAELQAEQDDSIKTHAQKQAEADAINKRADSYKIDQNQYWNNLGMGSHVGWYVAMAMSALGNALTGHGGAANPMVSMLQDKIKQNVVAHETERDRLRQQGARLDKLVDRFDQFSQNKQARILMKESEADKMLANQFRIAAAKNADAKDRSSALQQAAQLDQSSADKAQQAAQWAAGHEIQKRQAANAEANTRIAAGHLKETIRHDIVTEGLTQEQRDIESQRLMLAGKSDQAKLVRERALGGEVTPVTDASGKTVDYKTGLVTMKDGSVFIPLGTEASITALQKQHAAASQFIGTIDEIRKLGPEWLSNTANSEKKQRLDQLMGDLRLQTLAAKNLGVPTGHDIELAEKFIGTSDPTRFRDSLAGLNQARDSVIRDHNIELGRSGLDKRWDPPDLTKVPAAEPSQEEQIRTRLLEKPNVSYQTAFQQAQRDELASIRDKYGGSTNYAPGSEVADAVRRAGETAAKYKDIAPDQIRLIQDLKDRAANHDQAAFDALRNIGKDGATQAIRDLAVNSQQAAADAILSRQNGSLNYDNGTRVFTPTFNATAQPTFPQ